MKVTNKIFSFNLDLSWKLAQKILKNTINKGRDEEDFAPVFLDAYEESFEHRPAFALFDDDTLRRSAIITPDNPTHDKDASIENYLNSVIKIENLDDSHTTTIRQYLQILETNDNVRITKNELLGNKLLKDRSKQFPKGSKTLKFVGSMIKKHSDLKLIANFITQALSKFCHIQQNLTITFSMNPLDIILASESTTGWSSCYTLHGDYRAAILSFLLNKHTAIVYVYKKTQKIKAAGDVLLPRKIWRQWVFLNNQNTAATFGNQYPFTDKKISKSARKLVGNVLADYHKLTEPTWTVSYSKQYALHQGNWHYSEEPSSFLWLPEITTKEDAKFSQDYACSIGSELIYCLTCEHHRLHHKEYNGEKKLTCCATAVCSVCDTPLTNPEYQINSKDYCQDCFFEVYTYCDTCGEAVLKEDAYAIPNENGVLHDICETCHDHSYTQCDICQNTVLHDNTVTLPDNKNSTCCMECFSTQKYRYCEYCDQIFHNDNTHETPVDDVYYCTTCFNTFYITCNKCDKVVIKSVLHTHPENYLCNRCDNEEVI